MNNPEGWNGPEQPGKDNRWNYALLVPMLGLGVFRWIWVKKSQNEIKQIRIEHDKVINDVQNTILEKNKETAQLKLALEEKEVTIKKKEEEKKVSVALKEVEDRLKERQWVYCSNFVSRNRRFEIEEDLLNRTAKQPIFARLNMEDGLRDIFRNDNSCADIFNKDDSKNGRLMWMYLSAWKTLLTIQNQKKGETAVPGNQTKK